jgi:hypothetical protein
MVHKVRVYNTMLYLDKGELKPTGRSFSVGEFAMSPIKAMEKAERDNKIWMKRVGKGKYFPKVVLVKKI